MNTTLPASDDLFRSLFAIRICERAAIEEPTGTLFVEIQGKPMVIPIEHIDELEAREWIRHVGENVTDITDKGVYWLEKWGKRMAKRLVRA